MTRAGHTVLAVPIPALDEVVRERTAHYDASFVSRDPGFVHAHVTVLAPWVTDPTPRDLAVVAELAAATPVTTARLERVATFANGLIHLRVDPDDALRRLTARLTAAFPDHPPYGGAFPDPVPHLTLDHTAAGVTEDEVRDRVAPWLPLVVPLDRLDLQWWANDDCRLLHSWDLGVRAEASCETVSW